MDDTLRMHVTDSFANLSHKQDAITFCQREIIGDDAFKQLATGYAAQTQREQRFTKTYKEFKKQTVKYIEMSAI